MKTTFTIQPFGNHAWSVFDKAHELVLCTGNVDRALEVWKSGVRPKEYPPIAHEEFELDQYDLDLLAGVTE